MNSATPGNFVTSDALVFFGATGDLAYKQIFPALQRLAKKDKLHGPVIGVAKAGWTLDQFKARAKDSVEQHGGLDPEGFAKLESRLCYVDGDYNDPGTFKQVRQLLGGRGVNRSTGMPNPIARKESAAPENFLTDSDSWLLFEDQ